MKLSVAGDAFTNYSFTSIFITYKVPALRLIDFYLKFIAPQFKKLTSLGRREPCIRDAFPAR